DYYCVIWHSSAYASF
nr:immunoglobulin light chain junction region [Macaca mulatta]